MPHGGVPAAEVVGDAVGLVPQNRYGDTENPIRDR